jgi:hypothetical protein
VLRVLAFTPHVDSGSAGTEGEGVGVGVGFGVAEDDAGTGLDEGDINEQLASH